MTFYLSFTTSQLFSRHSMLKSLLVMLIVLIVSRVLFFAASAVKNAVHFLLELTRDLHPLRRVNTPYFFTYTPTNLIW